MPVLYIGALRLFHPAGGTAPEELPELELELEQEQLKGVASRRRLRQQVLAVVDFA